MVRRSIEISRETCQFSDVDSRVVKNGSEERCRMNVPGPQACNRRLAGTNPWLESEGAARSELARWLQRVDAETGGD